MSILTVIPVFYPDKIEQLSVFVNLLEKYSDVLCVFNDGKLINIGQSFSECPMVNAGTSGAYNIAINKYIDPYEYLWLWDQDSLADDEILNNFLIGVKNRLLLDKCGMFLFFDQKNEVIFKDDLCSIVSLGKSSGTLIKKNTIKEVGLFDESLFIDYSDYEYIQRALSKGYYGVQITELTLKSHIQGGEYKTMLGTFLAPSPSRLYYQKKGAFYLAKLEYISLHLKIKLFLRLAAWLPFSLIFDDRLIRIKSILGK